MNRILITFLLLVFSFPFVATAQVTATDDEKLSEHDKQELIAFTKRFVARMQRTRDISPLLKEFFVPTTDMATFLADVEDEEEGYKLSINEGKRLGIVVNNMIYASSLAQIIGEQNSWFDFRSVLPQRLALSLEKSYEDMFNSIEKNKGRRFRALLTRSELLMKSALQHLRRKNYERTAKYNRVIAEREKEDFYNYDINLWSPCRDVDKEDLACWVQRFGPDTRLYNIGTPYGLGPTIIESKNGYKILFLYPHPMSGG